jgi:LEA14-like dessication related protein
VQELASVLQSMIDIRDKVQEENQQLVVRCEMHNPNDISTPLW